jgi:hypothetical protein
MKYGRVSFKGNFSRRKTMQTEITKEHLELMQIPHEVITWAAANSVPWSTLLAWIISVGLPALLQLLGIKTTPLAAPPPLPTGEVARSVHVLLSPAKSA